MNSNAVSSTRGPAEGPDLVGGLLDFDDGPDVKSDVPATGSRTFRRVLVRGGPGGRHWC